MCTLDYTMRSYLSKNISLHVLVRCAHGRSTCAVCDQWKVRYLRRRHYVVHEPDLAIDGW